jgi:hypothetical protein
MEICTRQQLYDLVCFGPMRDVAQKLGLSDNGLRKHCAKAFVQEQAQGCPPGILRSLSDGSYLQPYPYRRKL